MLKPILLKFLALSKPLKNYGKMSKQTPTALLFMFFFFFFFFFFFCLNFLLIVLVPNQITLQGTKESLNFHGSSDLAYEGLPA